MRKRWALWVYLLFAPAILLTDKAAASEVWDTLRKLEDIRLTDYQAFSEGLTALETKRSVFNVEEADYFTLLKGYENALLGDYNQALQILDPLLNNGSKSVVAFRARLLAINLFIMLKDHLKAFVLLGDINEQLDQIDDEVAKTQAIANIAMLYNEIERYDISLFYTERFLQSQTESRMACRIQVHRMLSLLKLEKVTDFFADVDAAIDSCRQTNEKIPELIIQYYQMQALIAQGRYQEVLNLFKANQAAVLQTAYPVVIAGVWTVAANAFLQAGEPEQAETLAYQAVKHIEHIDVSLAHVELYALLIKLKKQQGDYRETVTFFEKLSELQKKYSDNKISQQLAYHQAKGETAIKNQRIALLDKDNEVLALQRDLYEQEARQNRLLVLILAAVLLLASALAYRGMTGRQRFKKIAEYDQLTGISNRYHFNKQARLALQYCEQNAKPVAVILFDLDHFKQINDLYGHAAGDWALQAVVKTCRNFMRNNDVFGRIGGEEFAVLLPGCQTDKATLLAEICRDAIASIDSRDSGFDFPLTASFGVSGSNTSGYVLKQLLSDADNAMYQAKAAGRNTVKAFSN
ncbi:tetratricopeptide repeat-containing diguanylate cyclase [Rheinheimera fenheensis]|uniref:tetratricopeptide repeat-containing diguanylate cyclase n=1 Tax=Rheinheimera fenheensis TaxID=3152295 RepID=UPI00325CF305